jgi:Xaa-Pro aminopeptidase
VTDAVTTPRVGWPAPTDFGTAPTPEDHERWAAADRAARPVRLARLRRRLAADGFDAYFGERPEHARYLTGFTLDDGEEKIAGNSGQFVVSGDEVVLFADSRYTIQARRQAPDASVRDVYHDLPARWAELASSLGAQRVAVEAGFVSHGLWTRLAAAAPDVELVAVDAWVEADRAVKEPAEIERIAAACAVADRALARLLPDIRPGVTETELALRLEWGMRTDGAEALAFEVACLSGSEAALPHGAPREHPVAAGTVLLFDFGAQVDGYRSDMTRTLFVGEPSERDLSVYQSVTSAQAAVIGALERAVAEAGDLPDGRALDSLARSVIADAGFEPYAHGLGHGIGLATHELPTLGRRATEVALPSPTVFSVEPGVYVEGETGVRIEDLVMVDPAARRFERLTRFPREVIVVG